MNWGVSTKRVIKALAFRATVLAWPMSAWADFSGPYAPANWTTTLTGTPPGGGGSVDASGAPASITLNGGDSPCITMPCHLDYTIAAPGSGTLSFHWDYQTTDLAPDFDLFLVLNNGTAVQLRRHRRADCRFPAGLHGLLRWRRNGHHLEFLRPPGRTATGSGRAAGPDAGVLRSRGFDGAARGVRLPPAAPRSRQLIPFRATPPSATAGASGDLARAFGGRAEG